MTDFKLYRWYIGGIWYKYQMSGEIPNCYGTFWSQYKDNSNRVILIKTENYEN